MKIITFQIKLINKNFLLFLFKKKKKKIENSLVIVLVEPYLNLLKI